MRISSYGCTWEVWRERKKPKNHAVAAAESNISLKSALQTSQLTVGHYYPVTPTVKKIYNKIK